MDKKQIFLGLFILLIFFAFFISLKVRHIPINPQKHNIGGCKGTRYGCCGNGKTACNKHCSNC